MSSTAAKKKQDDKKKSAINKLSTVDRDGRKRGVANKTSEKNPTKRTIENDKVPTATTSQKKTVESKNHPKKSANVPLRANHHVVVEQKTTTSRRITNKDVITRKNMENTSKTKNTTMHTNVTVNSPKPKRKEFEPTDIISTKHSLDIMLNNHKRYRTRTLDPDEVKVVDKLVRNIEYVDNSLDEKRPVAKPKSFFVPLDGDKKTEEQKSDESVNYDDDFDSYESDFDSCGSSDDDSDSGSDIDDVSSTTSGLSSLNKTKMVEVEEKSKNELLPPSLTSLTDEGFDENSAGLGSLIPSISKMDVEHSSQRAVDLKRLIILDDVKYNLFEFYPMSYDTFMTIYGKSNMNQAACQTNDDRVHQDVQTETPAVETKWSQIPVKFSNNQEFSSPMEIYLNQKNGCGSDKPAKLASGNSRVNFVRLTKFVNRAAKIILNKSIGEGNESIYDIIKERPLDEIFFDRCDENIVLSLHSNRECSDSIVCVWSLSRTAAKPSKILIINGTIKCCSLTGGVYGLVAAGLNDGNIALWNLKEQNMWFKNLHNLKHSNMEEREENVYRICSYHSGYDVCKSAQNRQIYGSCVDVLFTKSTNKDRTQQVFLLQEYGLLTVWIVVTKKPAYKNISDMDHYHSQWSSVSLIKTNAIDLNYVIYPHSFKSNSRRKSVNPSYLGEVLGADFNRVSRERFRADHRKGITRAFSDESPDDLDFNIDLQPEESVQKVKDSESSTNDWENSVICTMMSEHHFTRCILVVLKDRFIYNYPTSGVGKGARIFSCEDEGSFVTCLEVCPKNFAHFFAGCSGGVVHLYSEESTRPLRNFYFHPTDTNLYAYKRFTENSFNMISSASAEGGASMKGGFWLDWLGTLPGVFLIYFTDGRIVLWDLFNSDITPKLHFDYNEKCDGEKRLLSNAKVLSSSNANDLMMVLHFSNGAVEIHKLNDDTLKNKYNNQGEDLNILRTYFELL